MAIQPTEKIWHNGKWINWDDATLHVLSHVVSYGSAVFEGIRCYETKQGPAIFRVREHMQRLINSARICCRQPASPIAGANSFASTR